MKMTKTDWRSCLRSGVLDDLMMIHLNSDSIETFDPMPAIAMWNKAGVREWRPFYMEDTYNNDSD